MTHIYESPEGKKYTFDDEEWAIWKWLRPAQQAQYLGLDDKGRHILDQGFHKALDKYGKDPAYWPSNADVARGVLPDPDKWNAQWSTNSYDNTNWSTLTPGWAGGTGDDDSTMGLPTWLFWTLVAGGSLLVIIVLVAFIF